MDRKQVPAYTTSQQVLRGLLNGDGEGGWGEGLYPVGLTTELKWLQCRPQAPVVQKVESAIRWINLNPMDKAIIFPSTYPLDSDLSDG